MSNDEGITKLESLFGIQALELPSSFVIRASSLIFVIAFDRAPFLRNISPLR